MAFSGFNFLVLLPLFVLSFWLMPVRFQKAWLILLSLIVYMAAGWRDLALLTSAVLVNWLVPRLARGAKVWCYAMVVADLGFLGWFKYRGFFGTMLGHPGLKDLLIPLGISFYIFQLISYQVEIARKQVGSDYGFVDFFLYIFFFPHHQAGPIMRPHAFLICFTQPRNWYQSRFISGLVILLWGLAKKVWVADLIAPKVDAAYKTFHGSGGHTGNIIYLAVLYGVQIYGDFSGYSDMAVGLGRLFGFKFDRNFHQPYTAKGASEFWRRWHITLSQWLRDFVYIPLGGNRKGALRTEVNLMLTMLIGGLWHGAGWNFVLWGGLHGSYLVWERFVPTPRSEIFRIPKLLLFQLCVMLAWVPFRESSFAVIAGAAPRASAWLGKPTLIALGLMLAIIGFSHLEQWAESRFVPMFKRLCHLPLWAFAALYGIALYLVLTGAGHATTFIYQRF